MKKVLLSFSLFMFLGASILAFGGERIFMRSEVKFPDYASYPTQTFYFPSYNGKLFLANTAQEAVYASYPGYASYPYYASYPGYASYPNPYQAFEDRAQLACKFMNFSRARYASSQSASSPADLIVVGYDELGDIFASTAIFSSLWDTEPTFIDTLECVP